MHKGHRIYHAGERFRSVYAVHSGAVKTINVTQDGQEQIAGFYLAGERIGMGGIATGHRTKEIRGARNPLRSPGRAKCSTTELAATLLSGDEKKDSQ